MIATLEFLAKASLGLTALIAFWLIVLSYLAGFEDPLAFLVQIERGL
jgi:hypothetical protein